MLNFVGVEFDLDVVFGDDDFFGILVCNLCVLFV